MTSGQREVLTALRDGPRLVREVAAELWPHVASYTAYDRAHHRLRGLEELWPNGSYEELGRLVTHAPAGFRKTYLGVAFKDQPGRDLDCLVLVTRRMPSCIYVPAEVSENAGYLPGDARAWRMPPREQHRRWARRPART